MALAPNQYFGGPYAQAFADATNAMAAGATRDFQRDTGKALGGLASIGALRSGRTTAKLREMSDTFGRSIGEMGAAQAGRLAELNSRESIADADRGENARQFDTRLSFDERRDSRDFDYGRQRDARGDFVQDRAYERDVFTGDREFGEGQRRFNIDDSFRSGRAARSDMESDRDFGEGQRRFGIDSDFREREFGESTRRYNTDDSFRRDRATRDDFESDRGFDRGVLESDRGFNRDVYESDRGFGFQREQFQYGQSRDRVGDAQYEKEFAEDRRRYEQQRNDQIQREKRARKSSFWGKLGGAVVGGAIGFVTGGPAGAAVGAGRGAGVI